MFSDLVPVEGPVRPAPPAHRAATLTFFSPSGRTVRRFRKFSNAYMDLELSRKMALKTVFERRPRNLLPACFR